MNKNKSSVWPFELDTMETWAYWDKAFSKEECEKIIEIGKKIGLQEGKTQMETGKKFRDSNICWLYPDTEINFAFERITDIIMNLNSKFFKFDLFGFIEGFQFTHYQEPDGKYRKHVDRGYNTQIRKLSLSIQLSDPSSYEGGDFALYDCAEPIILPKEQGKLVTFPSYVLHEVKPVTKGERYSLVAWITGPRFK